MSWGTLYGPAVYRGCAAPRPRLGARSVVAMVVFALLSMCAPAMASATPPTCSSPGHRKPIFITEGCVDPRFNDPCIIQDTTVPAGNAAVEGASVPYTFIHGGFRGTDATFSLYFP